MSVIFSEAQAQAIVKRMSTLGEQDGEGGPFTSVEVEAGPIGLVVGRFRKAEWSNGDSTREYAYKLDGTELAP